MKDGPDISITATLLGDPARANMVMALMSGYSLTMGELTAEAGVTLSTASVHLAKLESSGIVVSRKQGRSRHFRIADPDVAHCTASAQDGWMTVKVSGCDLRIAGPRGVRRSPRPLIGERFMQSLGRFASQ